MREVGSGVRRGVKSFDKGRNHSGTDDGTDYLFPAQKILKNYGWLWIRVLQHTRPHTKLTCKKMQSSVAVGNDASLQADQLGAFSGTWCTKHGYDFSMLMLFLSGSKFNLLSLTQFFTNGWQLKGSK